MSDLKDELRRLADDSARQARPAAVAEVIREGDRRHRRAISPRRRESARAPGLASPGRPGRRWPGWAAPLAAAAAVIAVIAIAATVSGAIHDSGPAGHRSAAGTVYVEYLPDFNKPGTPGLSTVIPISTATSKAGKPIRIRGLGAAAITPDGKTLYAAPGDTIIPVSTATGTHGQPIRLARAAAPYAIAITPDGRTAYAVGIWGTVIPISTATNTPGRTIRIPFRAGSLGPIAFTPNGKTAYVVHSAPEGSGTVTPINTATNAAGSPSASAASAPVRLRSPRTGRPLTSRARVRSPRSTRPPTRPASRSTSPATPAWTSSRSRRTGRPSTSPTGQL